MHWTLRDVPFTIEVGETAEPYVGTELYADGDYMCTLPSDPEELRSLAQAILNHIDR